MLGGKLAWSRAAGAGRAVAFVVPVLACLPVVIHRYGYSDDYRVLTSVLGLESSGTDVWIGQGRPGLAAGYQVFFGAAGGIDGLWLVRLWAVAGIGGLSVFIAWLLAREGLPRLTAVATGIGCALLPTFVESAGWAAAASFPWVCLLSGAAGVLLTTRPSRRRTTLATALFVAAFLSYQPAAMFLWCVVAVRLVVPPRPLLEQWREVRRALAVTVVGVGLAVLILELWLRIGGLSLSDRAQAVTLGGLPAKLAWFASRLVVTGARPFLVSSPSAAQAAVVAGPLLLVTAAGLLARAPGGPRERVARLALVGVTVPMAALPNLAVAQNDFDFRLVSSLSPLMLILLVVAVSTLLDAATRPALRTVARTALLAAMVVAGVVSARSQLDNSYIHPAATKDAFFRHALAAAGPSPAPIDVLVPATGWSSFRNLGLLSMRSDLQGDLNGGEVAPSEVRLILAEQKRPYARAVPVLEVRDASQVKRGALLVDTRALQRRLLDPAG